MSFVGKILIVVQVVMSLVFMAFAGAVFTMQQNWQTAAKKANDSLSQAQSDARTLEENLNKKVSEADARVAAERNRADQAVNANVALNQQVANLSREVNQLNSQYQTQLGIAQTKSNEAEFRQAESERLRVLAEELRKAIDQKTAENRALIDQNYNLTLAGDQLAAQHDALLEQVAFLEKVIRQNPDLSTDPRDVAALASPPPPVDGIVVETRKDKTNRTRFVEISIGSDDGLAKFHELDVYRPGDNNGTKPQYLGRIRIIFVAPDKAVGTVIQAAKNGIIERGDNVTTKL
jgi:predicted Holliday junction resolvase-like endonuclease